jgi:hypothetical protein
MRTVDEALARAPQQSCLQLAADVERWPEHLPHYRWVTFREKTGFARGIVEMAAWRQFPGFRWPTWWVSEMEPDLERGQVRYRHIDGITRGMDVLWEVRAEGGDTTRLRIVHEWSGPPWPLIGGLSADRVIGPRFISHIAGLTLGGIVRAAEAAHRGGQ